MEHPYSSSYTEKCKIPVAIPVQEAVDDGSQPEFAESGSFQSDGLQQRLRDLDKLVFHPNRTTLKTKLRLLSSDCTPEDGLLGKATEHLRTLSCDRKSYELIESVQESFFLTSSEGGRKGAKRIQGKKKSSPGPVTSEHQLETEGDIFLSSRKSYVNTSGASFEGSFTARHSYSHHEQTSNANSDTKPAQNGGPYFGRSQSHNFDKDFNRDAELQSGLRSIHDSWEVIQSAQTAEEVETGPNSNLISFNSLHNQTDYRQSRQQARIHGRRDIERGGSVGSSRDGKKSVRFNTVVTVFKEEVNRKPSTIRDRNQRSVGVIGRPLGFEKRIGNSAW